MNESSTQVMLALATAYALQWLKARTWFPWLTFESEKLNRAASIAIACLSGFGIFVTFDHVAGILTVTGLTAVNLGHALTHAGGQFLLQHSAYRAVIAPQVSGASQDLIRKAKEDQQVL